MTRILSGMVLAAIALLAWPAPARAAESYDNCTGFIDSLPAVIGSQGVWCLRKDLSTSMTSGNAIEIATNNVTLDCNDFKIGGLAAGPGTQAVGVHASERANTTIRKCNVRGFSTGALLRGSGHLVEDNTFDSNTTIGIHVYGTGSEIRNNQVLDTGGGTSQQGFNALGIAVGFDAISNSEGGNSVDVIDNLISGVLAGGARLNAIGIAVAGNGEGSVVGNRVSGLAQQDSGGTRVGIVTGMDGDGAVIARNIVHGTGEVGGTGIKCANNRETAHANVVQGFGTAIDSCFSTGNTVSSN